MGTRIPVIRKRSCGMYLSSRTLINTKRDVKEKEVQLESTVNAWKSEMTTARSLALAGSILRKIRINPGIKKEGFPRLMSHCRGTTDRHRGDALENSSK